LLDRLPRTEAERTTLITLGDALCDGETLADMRTLADVRDGLPKAFSEAVLLCPRFLPRYLRYAIDAARDPHNDIALQLHRVCGQNHEGLKRAVLQLSTAEQQQLTAHVFDTQVCKPIAIPEADDH
jgi:hypothetical protein